MSTNPFNKLSPGEKFQRSLAEQLRQVRLDKAGRALKDITRPLAGSEQIQERIGNMTSEELDSANAALADGDLCRYCGSWTPTGAVCGCRGDR